MRDHRSPPNGASLQGAFPGRTPNPHETAPDGFGRKHDGTSPTSSNRNNTTHRATGPEWKLRDSASPGSANRNFTFGNGRTDCQLTGDWNGDGVDSVGIVRIVDGKREWQMRNSLNGGPADFAFIY
jgi:hypothetical protein